MELIDKLNWRYATKRMTGERVPDEKLNNILESIRLSASSVGLQPYKVLVIENPELRKQLLPVANNQPQITESSHLLVFAAWDQVTEQHIDDHIHLTASERGVSAESLQGLREKLSGLTARTPEESFAWTSRQTYIGLGTGLVAAAMLGVDATPMEGFDAAKADEVLGLKKKGLRSVTFLTLGFRDIEKDWLVNQKKVRRPAELFFEYH